MTEQYSDSYMKELWKTNKKDWFKLQFKRAKNWCVENKDTLMVVVPAACTTVLGMSAEYRKLSDRRNENKRRDLDIYDHSLGIYYHLRRKPKPHEYGEITRRRKNGEDYYTILSSMRLL